MSFPPREELLEKVKVSLTRKSIPDLLSEKTRKEDLLFGISEQIEAKKRAISWYSDWWADVEKYGKILSEEDLEFHQWRSKKNVSNLRYLEQQLKDQTEGLDLIQAELKTRGNTDEKRIAGRY